VTSATCEYGFPDLCGQTATWICYPERFPGHIYACDAHAPLMVSADLAHRLPDARPLGLEDLRRFVTALAWRAYLLRESNPLRADNARAAFRRARDEYEMRKQADA
jgi:hypothetical protein